MTKIFDRFLKDPSSASCGEGEQPCCGPREEQASCCDDSAARLAPHSWTKGRVSTPAGDAPIAATRLNAADRFGGLKMRLGIGRQTYTVPPGLYAVGRPDPQSAVFVSANYKLSFDHLRRALDGLDGWILVLDTRGINVWCAAGKGTFGTEELVRRIESSSLSQVVAHRKLILPQLGAPGVAAHEITKRTKFHVIYGPVRAADIPEFMQAGMKTTPEMRKVRFGLKDRLILTPVEISGLVQHWIFWVLLGLWILRLIGLRFIPVDFPAVFAAVLVGTVLTPALLPWIPGRAFAWKGWLLGLILAAAVVAIHGLPASPAGWAGVLSYVLVLPAVSAFLAMNFTGSSAITSLSGVVKEMRTAVPLIALSAALGVVAMIASAVLKA